MTVPHNGGPGNAIDAISKQIIEQLQEDGRRSYAAIGKAVGLSEAAVRQRVQKLVENRTMQIVAVTDPLQLGFTRQAMIGIVAAQDINATADRIAALPEVDYCVVTAGPSDILAEVICANDEDLLRVVTKIRGIEGVQSTTTFMYLSLKKQEYNWGTR
ncbi:Lrp/AsnC family transcriptional regulator [Glutamicibacter sp. MNS18]|uniref:Lrp/AsnC family transcriptional regulator n=1 Tax=Glutamicibacter sp. MNS18 TaxID=2989817 RepID=UPI002236033B|nr:Lrp/AsnC family transcriptional regulator [Glutamicibacter sp. MNS18]MCW4463920.1 Lrp/AsnC family transcriptional regulator [Glutamicibacter sp. MNS18]